LSAAEVGRFSVASERVWKGGVASTIRGGVETVAPIGRRPQFDVWRPNDPALKEAVRFVRDCIAPSDRLLVTWFAPDAYFFAERLFAAGLSFFYTGFFTSEAAQRVALSRLATERVPVVLTMADYIEGTSPEEWPLIAGYLATEFRLAGRFESEETRGIDVLVARHSAPNGQHGPSGLPCYR
jgi:hypothetical protein